MKIRKKSMRFILMFGVLLLLSLSLWGQMYDPVKWQASGENVTANSAELRFTAIIEAGWSMYAIEKVDGPIPTSFTFEPNPSYELVGDVEQVIKPEVKPDPHFGNINIGKFQNLAVFRQRIKILKPENFVVTAEVEYMSCNDVMCTAPQQVEFDIRINPPVVTDTKPDEKAIEKTEAKTEIVSVIDKVEVTALETVDDPNLSPTLPKVEEQVPLPSPTLPNTTDNDLSLWAFFLIAILAGFGGALTPCVYPMIPMTVSFFMRDTSNRAAGIIKAFIFGLSIILIYTSVGVIVGLTKRADLVNVLVSHWLTNLIFACIFITFALSFFGLYEITLGGSLTNKLDKKAGKSGYISAFFMALTLVIVSFSCTGPFVGGILVASTQGLAVKPILGMFGFGLAFALPFTLLAIFPSMIKQLPKSGGWMNSVKIVFAFVMLAFTFYFLSFADKGLGLNIITRDIFLCIWIVLFALNGYYLLGKIRFAHDSEVQHLGVPRLFFATASFVFTMYLFTGLLGAPLNAIAGLLPAAKNDRISVTSQTQISQSSDHLCGIPKYSDNKRLSWAHGLKGYFDYDEAIACAIEKNKPVLLIFKGHSCAKCREMEAIVWIDPEILHLMNDKFILLGLYTDDKTPLPENEWITSTRDGKVKKTMGQKNLDLEITRYDTNAFPYHAILNTNGETISTMAYTSSKEEFKNWLKAGLEKFML